MKTKGKINSKYILFFIFITWLIFSLGLTIFLKHSSTKAIGIVLMLGPKPIIALLSLVFSTISIVISLWFIYLVFMKGKKIAYNKSVKLRNVDIVLLWIALITCVITLILITIGFTQWDDLIIIT